MSRAIESRENSFIQVLLKLIPSEVIAVFIFIQGVMPYRLLPHLIVALLLLAITPVYLSRVMGVRSRAQLIVSTLSLAVWIYAMRGGPIQFIKPPFYEPWYGAVALAVWTLIPPLFLASPAREKTGSARIQAAAGGGAKTPTSSRASGRSTAAARGTRKSTRH
jgi:hypothetical protein